MADMGTVTIASLEEPVEIEEKFTLRVLGEIEYQVGGTAVSITGRRLIAEVTRWLQPDTCVRIDCRNAMLLGETLGCWSEGDATFVALELQQALTGIRELTRHQSDLSTKPHLVDVRARHTA